MKFTREFAMPSRDTFSVKPIGAFVRRYIDRSVLGAVDPFARNNPFGVMYSNDLNPSTSSNYHMDAVAFLQHLAAEGVRTDLLVLDPPYSPRQISECYAAAGLKAGMADTQNAALYARVREAALPLLAARAMVLSFGWSSNGMGKKHGFEIEEIMLCAHGGAHNDTICMAERRA